MAMERQITQASAGQFVCGSLLTALCCCVRCVCASELEPKTTFHSDVVHSASIHRSNQESGNLWHKHHGMSREGPAHPLTTPNARLTAVGRIDGRKLASEGSGAKHCANEHGRTGKINHHIEKNPALAGGVPATVAHSTGGISDPTKPGVLTEETVSVGAKKVVVSPPPPPANSQPQGRGLTRGKLSNRRAHRLACLLVALALCCLLLSDLDSGLFDQ